VALLLQPSRPPFKQQDFNAMSSSSERAALAPRKPKKGNIMSPATLGSAAEARKSQAIEKSQAAYQQMVKVSPDEIAQRAYELYMARGGAHGNDLGDWLLAESELLQARGMRQANA
jgi:Protein of unknown function (DUF2934)